MMPDHTIFFDQYLRFARVPVLQWQSAAGGLVRYRWRADVPGFSMPVKLSSGQVLLVTDQWKEERLSVPLALDKVGYCVGVEEVK